MIKSEVKEFLPDKMVNGMIRRHGLLYSFSYYVEKFEKQVQMTDIEFANYLSQKYDKYVFITNPDKYFKRVLYELKQKEDYEANIRISENDYIDVEEKLASFFEQANEDYLIPWNESYKTIYEVYETLKNNRYIEPSFEDKRELCEYFLNYIDEEIRTSIIDEVGISVEEYVLNQLPNIMKNATEVSINGEVVSIDEVIKKIADLQYTRSIEKEEKLNRTRENPSLVSEIYVEDNKKENLEATLDIPTILTDEEINALNTKNSITNEERYYMTQLRRLSAAIYKCSNEATLNTLKKEFFELNEIVKSKPLDNYTINLAIEIEQETIPKKERELHIFKNNSEDYIDAMMGKIHSLKEKVLLYETESELLDIETEVEKLDYEIGKRLLTDKEFSEANITLMEVKMLLEEKKSITKVIPNSNYLNRFLEKIIELKKILINIEYNTNKAEIVGYSIKFESSKTDLMNEITSALELGLLSKDESNVLFNKLEQINMLEQKSLKAKGGI